MRLVDTVGTSGTVEAAIGPGAPEPVVLAVVELPPLTLVATAESAIDLFTVS